MKRFLMFLLAAVLCVSAAAAEALSEPVTRENSIWLEGMEEIITERCHASEFGYTIWADAERFAPGSFAGTEHDYFYAGESEAEPLASVLLVMTEVPWSEASGFLAEAVALYPPENVGVEEQYVVPVGDGSVSLEYFAQTAQEDDTVYRFYAVKARENVLCITATYPAEAAEGWGVRIDHMIDTIEFSE